tara:strand:+ start:409 stop:1506 length:1098 start_codon:yes stop_codon:yes gene_type:complete
LKQVGVIRKNMGPLSLQVPLGESGFYFTPLGGTRTADPTVNPNVRSATEFSRASISADNAKEKLREMAADRRAAFNRDPDTSFSDEEEISRQQEEKALQRLVEAGKPQNEQERYMSESLNRRNMRGPVGVMGPMTRDAGRAAALAERAGRFGMAGRVAGAGVAGALGGLTGLLALQNAGAQGQDAISGLGSAGLRGMGTFSTAKPALESAGGFIGSRIGDLDFGMRGRASQMAGMPSGASQMAGATPSVGVAVPSGHRTPGVAETIAPPAPTLPPVAEPTPTADDEPDEKVENLIGVLGGDDAAKQTRDALSAAAEGSVTQSMTNQPNRYLDNEEMQQLMSKFTEGAFDPTKRVTASQLRGQAEE